MIVKVIENSLHYSVGDILEVQDYTNAKSMYETTPIHVSANFSNTKGLLIPKAKTKEIKNAKKLHPEYFL